MKAWCLFEQSGTFKNAFRKYGVEAEDYDILDDFGQTDHKVDLFAEIAGGYEGKKSIFDEIQKDDIVMAFFPCTRFEAKVPLLMRGQLPQQKKWTDIKKIEYSMQIGFEQQEMYQLICKMAVIFLKKGIKAVIENPLTPPHYLTEFWPLKPAIIDKDRTENGDIYKKPTQYWFLNCKPKSNLVFEPLLEVEQKKFKKVTSTERASRKVERSMMHPQYADRFIRQYILPEEIWKK